ncbi:hypothetical protein DERP_005916 [Dermatophagoides pteronyssinus]|uniref:Uncharacterized protein n=1 Tax=Dermatophagoides pteronyssinus TaxID=6956 RepID=A0ABQ8JSE9_DERPT|nr:hypothetical protein DERP_005916 [Dermatophagoides pteronyssinus]
MRPILANLDSCYYESSSFRQARRTTKEKKLMRICFCFIDREQLWNFDKRIMLNVTITSPPR